MNIKEMVDRRIEELRAQCDGPAPEGIDMIQGHRPPSPPPQAVSRDRVPIMPVSGYDEGAYGAAHREDVFAVDDSEQEFRNRKPEYRPEYQPGMFGEPDCFPSQQPFRRRQDDFAPGRREVAESPAAAPTAGMAPLADVSEFNELIDGALGEVASRVLQITEQMAEDYVRLERDMLQSRLEVLSNVESVLDIAMSLRREARNLLAGPGLRREAPRGERRVARSSARATGSAYGPRTGGVEPEPGNGRTLMRERASMRDRGVAALFRNTVEDPKER